MCINFNGYEPLEPDECEKCGNLDILGMGYIKGKKLCNKCFEKEKIIIETLELWEYI